VTGAFDGLPFADSVVDGFGAISDKDARSKTRMPNSPSTGYKIESVDIDARMRADYPTANRWDYGVIHGSTKKRIEFIEVHPAESGEVDVVIKKQRWLKDLMTGHSIQPHSWYWIPSGKITILRQSSYFRRLDEAGISLVKDDLQL
jgi:hypothetical protein